MISENIKEQDLLLKVDDGWVPAAYDPVTTETIKNLERVPVAFCSADYKPLNSTRVNFSKYQNIQM